MQNSDQDAITDLKNEPNDLPYINKRNNRFDRNNVVVTLKHEPMLTIIDEHEDITCVWPNLDELRLAKEENVIAAANKKYPLVVLK